jgi:hypothetical protein
MTFAGASFGYASVPNNHFNDWLAQYSFTGSSSSRLSLPEVGGMLLFARDHLAGGFEVGGSPRTGSIPYQTTLYAGLTGGYHKAFRGGRHLLLTASFGAGCSTFHFQKTPMGPGNIENATSYTLVNSGLYIGTSAKLFKTTRKIFGAGIDTGIRYHLHRNWDYYNIDIKKVTMNIGHDIPNIQGLSVYVNIPFGLCIDDNSSLQANLRR